MAQLIITVIGIALMVFAIFMALHYGVAAYDNKNNIAHARMILTQLKQIDGAYHAYRADDKNSLGNTLDPLVNDGYLMIKPMPPGFGNFTPNANSYNFITNGNAPYIMLDLGIVNNEKDVRLTVCHKINDLLSAPAGDLATVKGWADLPDFQSATRPLYSGCYFDSSDRDVRVYSSLKQ